METSPQHRLLSLTAALLFTSVALGSVHAAQAVGIGPSISVSVDGEEVLSLGCLSGLVCDPVKGTATLLNSVDLVVDSEYAITLFATDLFGPGTGIRLEPDPEIFYGSSVIDFGSPSTFGFVFLQGIVPTAAPGFASHDHSSSTSDGSNANGVPVTARSATVPTDAAVDEIAVYVLSTDGGGTYLNPGLDLSPSFVGPTGTSGSQGPFAESAVGPALSGFYDVMRVDLNFSMDGDNDSYSFNGRASIVPEPSTAALLLLGLGALGAHARSRR